LLLLDHKNKKERRM